MKRRSLALGMVAGTAAAAGVLWKLRLEGLPPPPAAASGESTPHAPGGQDSDFWSHHVERVDGSALSLASLRGQALIVNFWATWCPPCVREMPMIDRFHREQQQAAGARGWRILGLAIDRREAVAQFLLQKPVSYEVALAGLEGTAWSRALGNASGGLPFTVAFGRHGRPLYSKLGEISEAELRSWHVPPR